MAQHNSGFDPALGSLPGLGDGPAPPTTLPRPPVATPPTGTACRACSAEDGVLYGFATVTGMVFRYRVEEFRGIWCPSCAQSVGRRAQSRTMLRGWFGLISAVVNVGTIVKNSTGLWRARSLSAGRSATLHNPATLDSGKPVFLRPGMAGAVAVLAWLAWVTFAIATDATTEIDDLLVGDCLANPGYGLVERVETIDCSQPHDLEVFTIARVTDVLVYPGDYELNRIVDEACFLTFDGYVGAPFGTSSYDFSFIAPSADSWTITGDRTYYCLLGTPGVATSGSARDSGR